jgi:hypothetical protein
VLQGFSRFNALSQRPAPVPCPAVVAGRSARLSCTRTKPRRPARVYRLVAEPPRPALLQAKALVSLIIEETPEAIGKWLLKVDLEVVYRQLAEREGWPLLHWNRIGKELGKMCRRRQVRMSENGKRRRLAAYLIGQPSNSRLAA